MAQVTTLLTRAVIFSFITNARLQFLILSVEVCVCLWLRFNHLQTFSFVDLAAGVLGEGSDLLD